MDTISQACNYFSRRRLSHRSPSTGGCPEPPIAASQADHLPPECGPASPAHSDGRRASQLSSSLEQEKELVKPRYEQLDGICREMRRAIDALEEAQDLLQHGFTDHEVPDPLQHGFTGFKTPDAADLIRCMNLHERLELIAIVNWGKLNLAHAAEVIMAAGVTRASERTLRGEIRKVVKRNPQDWELIADDTFRYTHFEDAGDEIP